MNALVDRERACDGECFSASWEITAVRFYKIIDQRRYEVESENDERENELSCVCLRMCCCSVAASENDCLHTVHKNGLCPVCVYMDHRQR